MEHAPREKLYGIGLNAAVVITLMAAYCLSVKSRSFSKER